MNPPRIETLSATEPDLEGRARTMLREAGLRVTLPRTAVLLHLLATDRPSTHGEAAQAVQDRGLDRATVYRILIDLADAGLLRRENLGDNVWRFQLPARAQEHAGHAHFVCTTCNARACLAPDAITLGESVRRLAIREVTVRGLCDRCASDETDAGLADTTAGSAEAAPQNR